MSNRTTGNAVSHPGTIPDFQELDLLRGSCALDVLRETLIANTSSPWRHAQDREESALGIGAQADEFLAFERLADDQLPAVGLIFWREGDGYRVSNIVPLEAHQLTHAQYNAALQDFMARIVEPTANTLGLKIKTTAGEQSPEDWMSPDSVGRLKRFSRNANKSTGSSHPFDRERWYAFIIGLHAERRDIDTEKLARWLGDVEHWSDDAAIDLVIEYEFGRDLLKQYDGSR